MTETSLLIFTLCLQAAIGTMLFITLGMQLYKDKQFKSATIVTATLSVIGVFASLMHLGRPLSALNSLSNLGSSWLSNEAVLAGTFMGIAVLYALVRHFKPESKGLNLLLNWAGSIIGLAAVFSMAKVYTTTIVPLWQGANTFVDFFATTIALGALIFFATSLEELKETNKKVFAYIILAAVVLQVAVAVPHAFNLGLKGLAAQASAEIISGMSLIVGLKWLLILGGAGLLMWPGNQKADTKKAKLAVNVIYLGGTALVIGQILGRYIFYAAIVAMNVGLT